MKNDDLTVLSFGGGQDSTAILYKLAYDEGFRAEYAPGRLVVVMADTGDEHDETYDHVREVSDFCSTQGIEFHFLQYQDGFHTETWRSLIDFYRDGNRIGSKAYPKTCTDNLKVQPIYKWLDAWVGEQYGYQAGRKNALKSYAAERGKVRVLIGIARGEERRLDDKPARSKWMDQSIDRVYPLVDLGMDRADCQAYIASTGHAVPVPSHCRRCPFKTEQELLLMARTDRPAFDEWVELERAKVEANREAGVEDAKNFGVWKLERLPEVLQRVEAKYGHLTIAELEEHRMSHGHCVMSAY